MLLRLQKVAGRLGGMITDSSGKRRVTTAVLDPGSTAHLVVWVPSEALSDFDHAVDGMGLVEREEGTGEIVATERVALPVTVRVTDPGGAGQAVPASSK